MVINQVDDLRLIENTNTQVRYLPIVTQIIKKIGKTSILDKSLKGILAEWSILEEKNNLYYRNHTGKLTESSNVNFSENKETNAFKYYLVFAEKLGLIVKWNDIIRNSRNGLVLNRLIENAKNNIDISTIEKFFYTYFLLFKDADTILTTFDTIALNNGFIIGVSEKKIRILYYKKLLERLEAKIKISTDYIKPQLVEEIIKIKILSDKENPFAHKHLLPPRLEWFSDYKILSKNNGKYKFTNLGRSMYESMPKISEKYSDINSEWIESSLFSILAELYIGEKIPRFHNIGAEQKAKMVGEKLEEFYNFFENDGSMKIPYQPAYIFAIISMIVYDNCVAEFIDIDSVLKDSVVNNNFRFSLRKTVRLNESYISISMS